MMFREDRLRKLLCGKRILIAGYGREGKSTHALLQRLLPQQAPDIVEDNVALRAAAQQGYDMIVKSPGIPTFVLEDVCDLAIVTSQTDLFLQVYGDKVIGVTGTKGKSTTANLIATVLQRQYGDRVVMAGNMGIPLFDVLPQLQEDSMVVCEFSCHQLENIHRAPHIAVFLNLFQEHLDHYHSYRDYQMAKMNIGLRQQPGDYFFYCSDNAELSRLVASGSALFKGQVVSYNLEAARRHALSAMHLQGDHNLCNVEVVRLATQLLGVTKEVFTTGVSAFQGLEHRLQRVGVYRGITFYNDSISTIPEAAIAAVEALQTVDTLILGGFDRGICYDVLIDYLTHAGGRGAAIRNLALVGAAGRRLLQLLCSRLGEESVLQEITSIKESLCDESQEYTLGGRRLLLTDDYAHIVAWCYRCTRPGTVCLLSPAAASYDAFKNFEERGHVFASLVAAQGSNKLACE